MRVYSLTIVYDEEKEEIEYISEELNGDGIEVTQDMGSISLEGEFDEDGLEFISSSYIVGEA